MPGTDLTWWHNGIPVSGEPYQNSHEQRVASSGNNLSRTHAAQQNTHIHSYTHIHTENAALTWNKALQLQNVFPFVSLYTQRFKRQDMLSQHFSTLQFHFCRFEPMMQFLKPTFHLTTNTGRRWTLGAACWGHCCAQVSPEGKGFGGVTCPPSSLVNLL